MLKLKDNATSLSPQNYALITRACTVSVRKEIYCELRVFHDALNNSQVPENFLKIVPLYSDLASSTIYIL